ncbi:MAG: Tex family protein [Clostridia bacterium]
MDIAKKLSEEFKIEKQYTDNIIELIDEGNTIPFIARYRKERTNSCDDQVLREFADRHKYLLGLQKRKDEIQATITELGKWTEELALALSNAETMTEAEDIYRPYKQKKKTRASVAIAKGLQPLADLILLQEIKEGSIFELGKEYINIEKEIKTAEEAVKGACDIIAEMMSDNAELRKHIREIIYANGTVSTKIIENAKSAVYEMYTEYSEPINKIPSHRILAINRGENEGCLKVKIVVLQEDCYIKITSMYIKGESIFTQLLTDTAKDSFDRLIFPSVEREIRNDLTEKADEQAIKMFEVNLKPLLLQPPLKNKVVLAVDPAYRTGCKIAVVNAQGDVLVTDVVYPTPPQSRIEDAENKLLKYIDKFNVDVISIGNGTASKEAEIFVVGLIKKSKRQLNYAVVNEAGASVYSASKLGAEEFPEFDVSLRSAVSIGRRLQDPLAELIKIDVKSIGVGQYQHDMPQNRLTEVLDGVVEDCVNSVGVDLNTASVSLLTFVAGLNSSIAKNIIEYRKKNAFIKREQLLEVNKLGPKAFEQCAGFLRIPNGANLLDNTGVHPESYKAVEIMLNHFGYTIKDITEDNIKDMRKRIEKEGANKVAEICNIGLPTLEDIVSELLKPGRDIRDSLPQPELRSDLLDIKDLKEGMELNGTVRNVIDFGVFVDIGVHQDGLVHITQISDGFVKHPSEILSVGQRVEVKILSVDYEKNKISLSLKTSNNPNGLRVKGRNEWQPQPTISQKNESMDDMLKKLQSRFGRK